MERDEERGARDEIARSNGAVASGRKLEAEDRET